MKVFLKHNLLTNNHRLFLEWHPKKNLDLNPATITSGSGKKVWWRCAKGHEWEAVVCGRNAGNGCPFCAGQRATEETCLLNTNGNLAKEWHPTKNGELSTSDVKALSGKKVWWQCSDGHEWEARIYSRNNGRGCPFCSGRRPTEKNCLLNKRPDIAKEWHPTKNQTLKPRDVSVSSNMKVWWACKNNHEWVDTVGHRSSSGRGCPHCSGRKLGEGTCLLNVNPQLAREWHLTKNGEFKPINCHAGSNKKVWWVCAKGHEWEAKVSQRAKLGSGCPYCSGHLPSDDNCFQNVKPELTKEWHPTKNGGLTPTDITAWSRQIIWWRCKKGHEWQAAAVYRKKGSKCPQCYSASSMLELQVYAEIKHFFDDANLRKKVLRKEIDIYIPSIDFGVEIDGAYWHKHKQLQDKKKTQLLKENGIRLIRVRAEELEPITGPDIVYSRKSDLFRIMEKIFLVLLCQEKLDAKKAELVKEYILRERLVGEADFIKLWGMLPGPITENSLYAKNLALANEWHPTRNGNLTPQDIWPNSNKKAWWMCKKGHEWKAVVSSRNSGVGCPCCSGRQPSEETCLQSIWPEIANEWHPTRNKNLKATHVVPGSHTKVWWLCKERHEWEATVNHRSNGTGCPYCSGRRPAEETCLLNVNPELAKEWHPIKNGDLLPKEVVSRSGKKVWWRCRYGHEWQTTVGDRSRGRGCPYCSGRRATEENSLLKSNPDLANEWHPSKNGALASNEVKCWSNKKVWWRCKNGHSWQALVSNRSHGARCPECRKL